MVARATAILLATLFSSVAIADSFPGFRNNNSIIGTIAGDRLDGSHHADLLSGGDGDDLLSGGDGDDVLLGGGGSDQLRGGKGADLFVFKLSDSGVDEILDFSPEEGDVIVIEFFEGEGKPKLAASAKRRNFQIDYRGNIRARLLDDTWKNIVSLKRSNLTFKTERRGKYAFLRFDRQFN